MTLVKCKDCNYEWNSNSKRPNPRFITCPNCRANVELRPSKLTEIKEGLEN